MWTNPTGLWIRSDSQGDGHFGARRGKRRHAGLDLLCKPGQPVVSPCAAQVTRLAFPYEGAFEWKGLLLKNGPYAVKLFYLEPDESLIGQWIEEGQVLGHAQDISKRYGAEMLPHIHIEIRAEGTRTNPEPFFFFPKEEHHERTA